MAQKDPKQPKGDPDAQKTAQYNVDPNNPYSDESADKSGEGQDDQHAHDKGHKQRQRRLIRVSKPSLAVRPSSSSPVPAS